MLYDHCVRLCVVLFIGCLVFSAFLMYLVMWIWDCTYFSSLCAGALVAAGICLFSFCRLKNNCSLHVVCGGWGLMAFWNSGFVSPGYCSGISFSKLMSETCWAHNNWNKIASDIKLVFHSSTITMLNVRFRIFVNAPKVFKWIL